MDEKTIKEYLNRCSKCGGCMAACPLFAETQMEPLVARGKLFLIKNYLDGNLDLSKKMMELMSLCLLCKACTDQCPNSIPVDQLVLSIRQEIAQHKGISFVKKNIFQHFLQNNGRLNIAAKMANLYQRSGLQWLVRKSGILVYWEGIWLKEKLLPRWLVPFGNQVHQVDIGEQSQMRVAYYTGCLTNYVFPQTGHAVLEIEKPLFGSGNT